MAFLKKSLFLVLFLGLVSLSICDEEKRQDEDDDDDDDEEKRGVFDIIKGAGKQLIAHAMEKIAEKVGLNKDGN
uniref:Ocellatin-PT6 n=1 Tax=Leptodactylus pustulatus TaxID=1349691 RepID=OCE6_LEPPU|nr:RecName: Full=Ocellatin-PT6; Flags: Precursor [Leptodactylus pustulatus]